MWFIFDTDLISNYLEFFLIQTNVCLNNLIGAQTLNTSILQCFQHIKMFVFLLHFIISKVKTQTVK